MEERKIQSYRDLIVWQEGMTLAEMCFRLTKDFPKSELFGMVSQIRRASSAIPANIAEGYGREYRQEYIQYLRISQGSLKELETHLILSSRVGFMSNSELEPILKQGESVGKLLRALIRSLQR